MSAAKSSDPKMKLELCADFDAAVASHKQAVRRLLEIRASIDPQRLQRTSLPLSSPKVRRVHRR